ncbi:MAG: ion transporter [Pseudomonadales bacterium]|nr:ion transporter [Pseudomonadales bacterium]MDP4766022.1 ion transporter [Pseudomonadales bacterium]MDP4875220.1 ion transporter [Pseudomonadales bacterium]MDP4910952.1 ion transporter [Pseudomonadales bacterium]MDP5059458.1 ion transporter [Pseudomonadales bacterium]
MSWQSRFQVIVSNKLFEAFIIGIIITSALMLGVKTYALPPIGYQVIVVLDWIITLIFLVEISLRFLAAHPHRDFFRSGWNVFDFVIVTISLIPIDNSDMALVARLVRVFRVLRMVSIIPELRMLLNSLLLALPRLGYVMALMFIIFYIYAAVGSMLFADINPVLWGDIAVAMLTLFRIMTFEDWTDVMYETMAVYPFSWAFYITFIFLTAFAFLNMVIGIVVNVLEEEQTRVLEETPGYVSVKQLHLELLEIKAMLKARQGQPPD